MEKWHPCGVPFSLNCKHIEKKWPSGKGNLFLLFLCIGIRSTELAPVAWIIYLLMPDKQTIYESELSIPLSWLHLQKNLNVASVNSNSLKQWDPWNSQILTKQPSTTTKNYLLWWKAQLIMLNYYSVVHTGIYVSDMHIHKQVHLKHTGNLRVSQKCIIL